MKIYIKKEQKQTIMDKIQEFNKLQNLVLSHISIVTENNKTHAYNQNGTENIEVFFKRIVTYLEKYNFLKICTININLVDNKNQNNPIQIKYGTEEDFWDYVELKRNNNQEIPEVVLEKIYDILNVVNTKDILQNEFPDIVKREMNAYKSTYEDMQDSLIKLQDIVTNQTIVNTEYLHNKQIENDNIINERTKNLEEQYKRKSESLDKNYQLKKDEIDIKIQKFNEDVARFNLQENKAVRRELLNEMKEAIKEQKEISLSKSTIGKRKTILWTCILSMTIGLSISITSFIYLIKSPSDKFLLGILSSGLLLFTSTLIYFLRWSNSWFNHHAQMEFKNIQFSQDILRASWLAELVFEVGKESKIEIPELIIEEFSKNLFENNNKEEKYHPYDDILKIGKSFKKLKIGKNGIEVEQQKEE